MKISLREAKQIDKFRNIVNLMKTVAEEMTLQITPTGINVVTMDPTHVELIILEMGAGIFDEYEVAWKKEPQDPTESDPEGIPGTPVPVTIDLMELDKRLSTISSKDESVTFEYDEAQQKFILHISNPTTRRKRRFGISVLEPLEEEVPIPKIVFKATGQVKFVDMDRAFKDAELVSEHIQIAMLSAQSDTLEKEPQIQFKATGDVGDSFLAAEVLSGNVEEESKATYTLGYLMDLAKAVRPLADVVEISLTSDMPLKLKLLGVSNLEAEFYLAPCIGV